MTIWIEHLGVAITAAEQASAESATPGDRSTRRNSESYTQDVTNAAPQPASGDTE